MMNTVWDASGCAVPSFLLQSFTCQGRPAWTARLHELNQVTCALLFSSPLHLQTCLGFTRVPSLLQQPRDVSSFHCALLQVPIQGPPSLALLCFHSMDTSFVILSVSIVGIVATALLLLSYYLFLTRCGLLVLWRSADDSDGRHLSIVVVRERPGLQAADIRRIPTFRYRSDDQKTKSECAVCLADFRPGERLRLLPPCRHAFHIDCIDAWLQTTANCPLCRATVLLADAVIEISCEAPQPSRAPAAEEQQPSVMRGRRSLSMDSSTDKRFYLALQRMLHHQQHQEHQQLPPEEEPRSLRRSFFSFSHSRSASILPLLTRSSKLSDSRTSLRRHLQNTNTESIQALDTGAFRLSTTTSDCYCFACTGRPFISPAPRVHCLINGDDNRRRIITKSHTNTGATAGHTAGLRSSLLLLLQQNRQFFQRTLFALVLSVHPNMIAVKESCTWFPARHCSFLLYLLACHSTCLPSVWDTHWSSCTTLLASLTLHTLRQ